jgi:hypothetical protein
MGKENEMRESRFYRHFFIAMNKKHSDRHIRDVTYYALLNTAEIFIQNNNKRSLRNTTRKETDKNLQIYGNLCT